MKTTLNPRMKATEFSMTFRSRWDSWVLSCSTPTPEISDTYPGTSGNTHGERNDTRPARKAAIGRGRLVITGLFYLPDGFALANKCGPRVNHSCLLDCAKAKKLQAIYVKLLQLRTGEDARAYIDFFFLVLPLSPEDGAGLAGGWASGGTVTGASARA